MSYTLVCEQTDNKADSVSCEPLRAFWEDRYHAPAIDADDHLMRCLIYIDLNMVRAGVVQHPSEWSHGGYNEILNPPARYRLLARDRLKDLLAIEE